MGRRRAARRARCSYCSQDGRLSASLAGAAASAGPVGMVAGAGAAGIGLGTLIAENTGVDEAIGDGLFDVLGPEPGLWLADNLPSWLQ